MFMMNPIRRKAISSLTEAVYKEIEALDPESAYAKQLSEITDINATIAEEIEKIYNIATLGEMTEAFLLLKRLKIASVQEKKTIKNNLSRIAEKLVRRVEAKSEPLRLSEICQHLFSEL